jgi:hypothetical protein
MVWAYWKHVSGLAAREAAKFLHLDSPVRLVMAALALLIAVAVLVFWQPTDALQAAARFLAALLLIAYPFVFFWKLIRIPPHLMTEAALGANTRLNETASALESRLAAADLRSHDLERRLEPKLQIVGLKCGALLGISDKYFYDVEIKNGGGESFDNCLVKVEGIDITEGTPVSINLPLVLRTQSQYDDQRSGSFNLRPEERKSLKFIREAQTASAIVVEHEGGTAVLHGVKRCVLSLTAYGPPSPTHAAVEVWLDLNANNRLAAN